jgi:hypothetical protein
VKAEEDGDWQQRGQNQTIGIEARKDMQDMFEAPVHLELWVKVKSGWADDERARWQSRLRRRSLSLDTLWLSRCRTKHKVF